MEMNFNETKEPINSDDEAEIEPLGVHGKWGWPIRIISFLLFVATVIINNTLGAKTGNVSDAYHLYITPAEMFFIIWIVIYSALTVVNVYNLVKNQWTEEVHFWFSLSNIANSLWIIIFNIGNDASVFACSFILLVFVILVLKTWFELGQRSQKSFNIWTYITRNAFAFYLGWLIAAVNINLGMDIVYWWMTNKETQLAIFWVMTPLCAIGVTALIYVQEGKKGLLSCFMLCASVTWAFIGAAITSHGCLTGQASLC